MGGRQQWYAGVDWGSQSHHVVLTDGDGRKIGERSFKHGGEGLAEMAAWLMAASCAAEPGQVLAAIEVPHGPVVETLIERGFKVHAINPKQMDRFRDRFTMAGAKDDSRDAEVMASALRTDPRCFRSLAAADPIIVELREWSRIAEDLGVERNRLINRLREQLWRYFPALLELEDDLGAEWLLELWEAAPTPNTASRLREATIAKLLKRHRIRRFDAASVVNTLRRPPVRVAAGTVEAASAHVALLVPRIRLLNRQIKDAHSRIDGLTARLMPAEAAEPGQKKQHDAEILASLPGVGKDRPRHAARRSLGCPAATRLRRLAQSRRSRAGHQEVRKELRRRPTTGLPRPPRQRRLPLGPCRRSARSAQPRQIRRTPKPRS